MIHAGAAKRVRLEMNRCGYTLERLSETTQVSQAVLRGILNGRAQNISTRTLWALSRAFDYDTATFIDLLSQQEIYEK